MKRIIASLSLLVSTTLFSTECSYQTQSPKISWKAFKTYEKIGVSGVFDTVAFKSVSAKTIEDSMIGNTISIETKSINSGNSARDATLLASFFNIQNTQSIKATIESIKNSKAYVAMTMNGVTKVIPMSYTVEGNTISAKGSIDLGDFMMLPSLIGINKACYDLHEGKTWQDVEIGFKMDFTKVCH